ncbi:trimethylamine methyltransferase family protein [uncultured Thiothrix sp.]|uniref:trimethylamine methyltransferase family protein n=1 Tax=uncultured Thiothrix sp. TaxID=223185 RepID=UPI002630790C|nr:trimethylamine methyltransferase family protein [uncultured Thiothrix sp.]HMT93052.1 trimethylamine methyltransferase family protein [Thiolinea sp.]
MSQESAVSAETASVKARPRRSKRPETSTSSQLQQLPWQILKNPYKPIEIIYEEQIEQIHHASMRILEEVGMDILDEDARALMKQCGAKVTEGSHRVHFDRHLIMHYLASVPESFTLHARNPAHHLQIGKNFTSFGTVASAPNASSMDGGRRAGNHADYQNFLRLMQSFNILQFTGGYPVEPVDIHASVRHLDCLADCVTLTDKVFHAYSLGRQRNRDGIEIARIARGISHEHLEQEPSLFTIINSSSPLRLDQPMLQGIMEMSARNQVVMLTPFTLAGAMAPVTLAGAIAQQNAEALAGIAFTQMVRRGAPAVYGGFTSNVDMKSGAPAFGTPEYVLAAQISGQLARHYQIPFRSSNVCASNTVDAQAAYESTMALWGAIMGGANFLMHGAGWLEGGLCASFEKLIIDADLLQMMAVYLQGVTVDEATLALEAVKDVGPGGHYFGTAHTMARYKEAFYAPLVSDWRNFETWQEAGSPTTYEHAHQLYKQILQHYEPPPLDAAIREELDAFVARRKSEGGVATDF